MTTGRSTGARSTKGATAKPRPTKQTGGTVTRSSSAASRKPGDIGSAVDAVKRDLAALAKADLALARSGLAAAALELARQLDAPTGCNHAVGVAGVSPTAKSMCAGQLRDTLGRLRELVPKAAEKDGLDALNGRRTARLARRPKAAA